MHNFGMNLNGAARGAHLALVKDGPTHVSLDAASALRPVNAPAASRQSFATTGYIRSPQVEAPRSRHELDVRAVAQQFPDFESALLPMVEASGVFGDAALTIAKAIMNTPALKAQAERAFQRSRLDVV
ncbi:MAG: hypothetical protein JWO69_470 [Thermoleophilia bacterium]|jgi:hypothetical protein|nr:hypothetical protein [Thermoleophilia bacterium]